MQLRNLGRRRIERTAKVEDRQQPAQFGFAGRIEWLFERAQRERHNIAQPAKRFGYGRCTRPRGLAQTDAAAAAVMDHRQASARSQAKSGSLCPLSRSLAS